MNKVVIILALSSSVVLAQTDTYTGSPRERMACAPDAIKFCVHSVADTPFTVAACFRAHLRELSPECRAVLRKHGVK